MDILSDLNVVGKIEVNSNGVSTTIGETNGMNGIFSPNSNLTISSGGSDVFFCASIVHFNNFVEIDENLCSFGAYIGLGGLTVDTGYTCFLEVSEFSVSGLFACFDVNNFIIRGNFSPETKNINVQVPANCTRFVITKIDRRDVCGAMDYPFVSAYKDNKKVDLDVELVGYDNKFENVIGNITACSSATDLYVSIL